MSFWSKLFGTKATADESFIDDVFSFDFRDSDDRRAYRAHPRLKQVPDLVNEGKLEQAEQFLQSVEPEFNNFDFIHLWIAKIYARRGDINGAREAYIEGMRRSKCRHDLCGSLAQLEFEQGNYIAAVRWWTRSALLQASLGFPGTDQTSFAYLSFTARLCRLQPEAERLNALAAIGQWGGIGFTHEKMNELNAKFPNQHGREIATVIQELVRRLPARSG